MLIGCVVRVHGLYLALLLLFAVSTGTNEVLIVAFPHTLLFLHGNRARGEGSGGDLCCYFYRPNLNVNTAAATTTAATATATATTNTYIHTTYSTANTIATTMTTVATRITTSAVTTTATATASATASTIDKCLSVSI